MKEQEKQGATVGSNGQRGTLLNEAHATGSTSKDPTKNTGVPSQEEENELINRRVITNSIVNSA